MSFRHNLFLGTALTFMALDAHAQGVQQSGSITPGHAPVWIGPGIIGDAGTSIAGTLTTLGITSSSIQAFGINDSNISLPFHQFTIGSSPTLGYAAIDLESIGGATGEPLYIINNGHRAIQIDAAGNVTIPSLAFSGVVLNNGTINGGTFEGSITLATGLDLDPANVVLTQVTTVIPPALTFGPVSISGTNGNGGSVRAPGYTFETHTINDTANQNNAAAQLGWDWVYDQQAVTGSRSVAVMEYHQQAAITPDIGLGGNTRNPGIGSLNQEVTLNFGAGGTGAGVGNTKGAAYSGSTKLAALAGATYWTELNAGGEHDITVVPTNETITLSGSVTGGDTLSINFFSPILSINETVTYTTIASDTLPTVVNGLAALIVSDNNLITGDVGFGAAGAANINLNPNLLALGWPQYATDMVVTLSTSIGATETITPGTIQIGASTNQKFGISFVELGRDGSNGVTRDSLIQIGKAGQAFGWSMGGWQHLITIGGGGGTDPDAVGTSDVNPSTWPFSPDADLIVAFNATQYGGNGGAPIVPQRLHSVLNLPNVNFAVSGGAPLIFPGSELFGDGSLQLGSVAFNRLVGNAGTAGIAITANGWEGTAMSIVNGGGAVNLTQLTNRYFVGDIVTCGLGDFEQVTNVNSLGAVTGFTLTTDGFGHTNYPAALAGSMPSGTCYPQGGSGGMFNPVNTLALGITWTAGNSINIGGSGQTVNLLGVVNGGTLSSDISTALLTPPATGGVARTLGTISLDYVDVLNFGADPTGTADSSAAINHAGGVSVGGGLRCAYLPGGTYYVASQLTVPCIVGDGMAVSTITVDQHFASGAAGVIIVPSSTNIPVYRDFGISFAQPLTQTTRANFLTLAGGCTSGSGGTGCKYPPAISYSVSSGRIDIEDVQISSAWDGITFVGNAGAGFMDKVYIGALDVGFQADGILDDLFVTDFQFWPFGFSGGTTLENDVFMDGHTKAVQLGRMDGINVKGLLAFVGEVELTSNFTFGVFSNVQLDTDAFFSNESTANTSGVVQITNMEASGSVLGSNTNCQLNFTGTKTTLITSFQGNGSSEPSVCVTGGRVEIIGGQIGTITTTTSAITQSGGLLTVANVQMVPSNASAFTVPIVNSTAGILNFVGNNFPIATTNTEVGVVLADSQAALVSGNALSGWGFTAPGTLGSYTGQVSGTETVTGTLVIPGTFLITSGSTLDTLKVSSAGGSINFLDTINPQPIFQFLNSNANAMMQITQSSTSAVANYIFMKAAVSGSPVVYGANGSDSNISTAVSVKGTGEVQLAANVAIIGGVVMTAGTCGGTGTVSGHGSDFTVQIGGTSSATCTITPATNFPSAPICTVTPQQLSTGPVAVTSAVGSVVITAGTASTNGIFNVHCFPAT